MEERKKIIIAITGNIATDQRMQRIANSLSKWYDVSLFYRHFFKNESSTLSTNKYPYECIAIHSKIKSGILFYIIYNFKLFFKLYKFKADIYNAVDSDTLLALSFLSILKRKPMVYDAHEFFKEVPELENKPLKKWIWNTITQIGVNTSHACYTVSDSLAIELEKEYHKPFQVIRNVPEISIITEQKFPVFTIIYQGALNKGRGLELLIKTVKNNQDICCIIAGEGDLSQQLRWLSKGISNLNFVGLLSPIELKKLTQQCHVGYNLLEPIGKSYKMSLSNKYFDYIQAEIPSISSEFIEYQSLNSLYKTGVSIPFQQDDLIKTIYQLKDNIDYYNEFTINCKIAKKELNWEKEELKLKNIYLNF